MKYSTRLDTTSRIITSLLIGVCLVLLTVSVFTGREGAVASIVPALILVVIVTVTWSVKPLAYELTADALIIIRPLSRKRVLLADIAEVFPLAADELKGSIRSFGSGGLFGYLGYFASQQQGAYEMWCTDRTSMVMIILKNKKKLVISPVERNEFVLALQQVIQ
ncbi:PH domain-containing protein [Chitinophaga sp. HK235]|uniref:PH domain-containing protein n=1 Tax=Chitinophaga sp. HK235 TaxID=2952571 RepID=UPI001BAD1BD0|nr:PH domain-containing protein [Chitinophaga sp. HK235]